MSCPKPCACECHREDIENPAPHLATCAWADESYEPPGMREDMQRIAADLDNAAKGAIVDMDNYQRDNSKGPS